MITVHQNSYSSGHRRPCAKKYLYLAYDPEMTQKSINDLMLRRVREKSQMGGTHDPRASFYPIGKYATLVIVNLWPV